MAFPAGLLFVCLHCALSYHGATAPQDLAMAYLRIVLAAIAFVTLILSILPGQPGTPPLTQPPPPPTHTHKPQGVGVEGGVRGGGEVGIHIARKYCPVRFLSSPPRS